MATPNYEIDPNDERLTQVKSDEKAALSENEKTYDGIISGAEAYYDKQIQASKDWEAEQKRQQQERTDFTIKQIEQDKAQAQKDYTKEQSGAYVDWQKQSNQYGANAEQMAASGLDNTGFSESSQVAMYTAYQNRVATARAAFEVTKQNFANAITEAQLQNSSLLAEIAYNAQQKQLELNMQKYMNSQTLLLEKVNAARTIEQMYHTRYQDTLSQINAENSLAEQVRQFNEQLQLEKYKFAWQKEQAKPKTTTSSKGSSGGGGSATSSKGSSGSASSEKTSSKTSIPDNKETMDSITALGYGPISAEALAKKVDSGEVDEYTENGVTKFKKNNLYVPESAASKAAKDKPWLFKNAGKFK